MLEEAFNKYVSSYDLSNELIKLKYDHSYRVMELSIKYATELGFNDSDIELCKIIGLLHDFGRFEQLKVYNTFDDNNSIDHADYSVEQLFDKGLIVNFTDRVEDYELIRFAIKNHNKFEIEATDDERKLKFARFIKDMDKLDIVYLLGYLGELNSKATNDEISLDVLEGVRKHNLVSHKAVKNDNDDKVLVFCYAFDIYNPICYKELKNNLYYYYKQLDGEEKFKEVFDIVNKYIDERMC